MKDIRAVSREIVRKFHPQRFIPCGSHAWGTPTEDSDVDLLVVMPLQGHPVYEATEIRASLRVPFPLDVIAEPPEGVAERVAIGDGFMRDILKEGVVLYEEDDSQLG